MNVHTGAVNGLTAVGQSLFGACPLADSMRCLSNPSLKKKAGGGLVRLTEENLETYLEQSAKASLEGKVLTRLKVHDGRDRVGCSSLSRQRDARFLVVVSTRRGSREYIPFGFNADLYIFQKILELVAAYKLNVFDGKVEVPGFLVQEMKKKMDGPDFELRIRFLCRPDVIVSTVINNKAINALLASNEAHRAKLLRVEKTHRKALEARGKKLAEQQGTIKAHSQQKELGRLRNSCLPCIK